MKIFKRAALASTLSVLALVSPAQTFASEQQTTQPAMIKESDVKQSVQQITPSSIYDNAIEFKEGLEGVKGYIRNKYETPQFFKVKFDADGIKDGLKFFSISGDENHRYKIFVYDEKYLSVGDRESDQDIVLFNTKADQWYYVEVRQIPGYSYSSKPFTVMAAR
ncbi:hypothetical protein [Aneurinibacillus migulanus]|uniref:Uncharacterized protein n=1 Tax=Aneurinibacillus migulanus TaxID=47500 RepID=A0A0D1XCF8_ANEMI|nr:hypothetical protein [Aneurinibacillus migulanus]KIV50058.1 hypothetical protein TS65_29815 [Aneurinibacillus migulanus]KON95217.1 hypothetical protein AF333_06735 [Aneurinibacillus migulanus]MED0895713.1 hypothetical protein [Aneurinibacillus migulanus]MED1619774.1 hypothetical protein [Aneurinibacillus migulanus]SDK32472.1 hypothetical protein SAMN04487909_1496 [Aneurinibacillus migulanus]